MLIVLKVENLFCYKRLQQGLARILFSPSFEPHSACASMRDPSTSFCNNSSMPQKSPQCGKPCPTPNCFRFHLQHWSLPKTAGERSDPRHNKSHQTLERPRWSQGNWPRQHTQKQLTADVQRDLPKERPLLGKTFIAHRADARAKPP